MSEISPARSGPSRIVAWLQLAALVVIAGLLALFVKTHCDRAECAPRAEPTVAGAGGTHEWVARDLQAAREAVEAEDFARAEAALNEAQALAPDNTDVRLERYRAVASRIASQPASIQDSEVAAVQHGLEILEWQDGKSALLHVTRGHLAAKKGNLEAAARHFADAIALEKSYVPAHLGQASLARTLAKPLEALAAFERAVEAGPDHLTALNNLGVQYVELGRHAEGAQMFERALKIQDNAATRLNLGDALAGQKRLPEAAEHLRRAASLAPGSAATHRRLGVILQALGRTKEAEQALVRSLEIEQNAATLFALGTVYQTQQRMDHAVAAFQSILRADPSNAASLFELARTLEAMHQTERARAAYEKLLEIAGNAPDQAARVNAARVALERLTLKPTSPPPASP